MKLEIRTPSNNFEASHKQQRPGEDRWRPVEGGKYRIVHIRGPFAQIFKKMGEHEKIVPWMGYLNAEKEGTYIGTLGF